MRHDVYEVNADNVDVDCDGEMLLANLSVNLGASVTFPLV